MYDFVVGGMLNSNSLTHSIQIYQISQMAVQIKVLGWPIHMKAIWYFKQKLILG